MQNVSELNQSRQYHFNDCRIGGKIMATYIKSVANSVEQNTQFPVITLDSLGIINNISVRERRKTKWYNNRRYSRFG